MNRWTRSAGWRGLCSALLPLWLGACAEDRPGTGTASGPVPVAAEPLSMHTAWPSWGGELPPLDLDRESAIRAAELERHAEAPALVSALADEDPRVRARAAWALGRIGGEEAAARLAAALDDPSRPPTPASIVALSFLEPPRTAPGDAPEPRGVWQTLEDAAWVRYAVTEDEPMAEALLFSIARLGGQRSQQWLAADTSLDPTPRQGPRHRAALQAAAILCARGHAMSRAGLRSMARALLSSEDEVRKAAALAASRCAAPSAEALAGPERGGLVERLAPMVLSQDQEEARLAWRALAGLGEIVEVPAEILGSQPPPWMVEVEAVTALAGHADGRRTLVDRFDGFALQDVDGPRVHVLLAGLAGLRKAIDGTPELLAGVQGLERRVNEQASNATGRRAKALALVGCELRFLQALRTGDIAGLARCAENVDGLPEYHGEILVIDALLMMGAAASRDDKMNALLQRARDPRPTVAAAALTGLADLDDPRISAVLQEAMRRPDPGVQAAAASSIAVRSMDASRRDETIAPLLLETLSMLEDGRAIEARLAIVEALGHLARPLPPASGGAKPGTQTPDAPGWVEAQLVPLAKEPAWSIRAAAREALLGHEVFLHRFDELVPSTFPTVFGPKVTSLPAEPEGSGIRLHTDAGVITIAFDGAPAPIMQAHLVRLAKDGYFDGLTFHRVVPGFVVQGGDPRGDGYGGPGWLVPCEWSNLRYERGTVGIALAGKDTGGSQIFIAQAPQAHLDGRYTVVGRVIEGLDVVDRMLVHDRISNAEVIP